MQGLALGSAASSGTAGQPTGAGSAPAADPASALTRADALEAIAATYRGLQALGFHAADIEAALEQLPLAGVSQEAALDWLLLHLEPSQLPRRFAGQARQAAAAVDVRLRANEQPGWGGEAAAAAAPGPAPKQVAEEREAAKRKEEEEARLKQARRAMHCASYKAAAVQGRGSASGGAVAPQLPRAQAVLHYWQGCLSRGTRCPWPRVWAQHSPALGC